MKKRKTLKAILSYLLMLIVGMTMFSPALTQVQARQTRPPNAVPSLDASLPDYGKPQKLTGTLTIAGTDAMRPIMAALVSRFLYWHPDLRIIVQGSRNFGETYPLPPTEALVDGFANSRRGSSKAQGHLASQFVKLLAISRALTPEEISEFVSRHGYTPIEVPIGREAVGIYVHADNPLEGLTLEQLDAFFSITLNRGAKESIRVWKSAGLQGDWADLPIRLFGVGQTSLLTHVSFYENALMYGELREDVEETPGSASLVIAVAQDPSAIGYAGVGYKMPMVRTLAIAKKPGLPYFLPTTEYVSNGIYPLSYSIHLYVNKHPKSQLPPVMAEFLKFVNSRQGQSIIIREGVYPLTAPEALTNLQRLEIESAGESDKEIEK